MVESVQVRALIWICALGLLWAAGCGDTVDSEVEDGTSAVAENDVTGEVETSASDTEIDDASVEHSSDVDDAGPVGALDGTSGAGDAPESRASDVTWESLPPQGLVATLGGPYTYDGRQYFVGHGEAYSPE